MTNYVSPTDEGQLKPLINQLAQLSYSLITEEDWPARQLKLCADVGVFRWFSSEAWGGQANSAAEIYQGYMKLAASCLTTTFIITQRQGACRRIENSGNEWLAKKLIPSLNNGELFATVGISHLTTSRRHLKKPIMRAEKNADGFVLDGFSPWVTGANVADWVVVGATLHDGTQILIAVDTELDGVTIEPGSRLIALSASQTGSVHCDSVFVSNDHLLAGPIENVMQSSVGGNAGGLQTSALALGLSDAAIRFVQSESEKRPELQSIFEALSEEWTELRSGLLRLASGDEPTTRLSKETVRTSANSLALRSTQAALTAAKGSGFVEGHPVGRWCREALFFLVWSCPQAVAQANLCEFAGIDD